MKLCGIEAKTMLDKEYLTPHDWYVLSAVAECPSTFLEIQDEAVRQATVQRLRLATTVPDIDEAADNLISKGFIEFLSRDRIFALQNQAKDSGVSPVLGFPSFGSIDFSPEGAELFQRVYYSLFRSYYWCDAFEASVDENCIFFYVSSTWRVDEVVERFRFFIPRVFVAMKEIGPWKARWWQEFKRGFKIRVSQQFLG